MKTTYSTKKEEIKRQWHLFNVDGKILGRVATDIAKLLIGKNKPSFSPHINTGDHVVVINAEKIAVTGKKLNNKIYYRVTGYPGGVKSETLGELLEKKPTEVVKKAVWGMLPKNKLRKERMKNLHVYTGEDHPHGGQLEKNAKS
jgi:large subunit ribosomal protein L13